MRTRKEKLAYEVIVQLLKDNPYKFDSLLMVNLRHQLLNMTTEGLKNLSLVLQLKEFSREERENNNE